MAADKAEEERRLLLQQVGRRRRRRRRRGRREEEGLVPLRLRGMLCHVSGPVLRAVCVCCVVVGEGVKTEWGVAPLASNQRFAVSFSRLRVLASRVLYNMSTDLYMPLFIAGRTMRRRRRRRKWRRTPRGTSSQQANTFTALLPSACASWSRGRTSESATLKANLSRLLLRLRRSAWAERLP